MTNIVGMKMHRCYFILSVVLVCIPISVSAFETRSMKESRFAFLLGMSDLLKEQDGWENLPNDGKSQLYKEVARAYAVDLGATPDELTDNRWRERVLQSLRVCREALSLNPENIAIVNEVFGLDKTSEARIDLRLAYLSGAYACHGTTTGFKLIDKRHGSYIALTVHGMFKLQVESVMKPGIPGNMTITLSAGRKDDLEYFFLVMQDVREAIVPKIGPKQAHQ